MILGSLKIIVSAGTINTSRGRHLVLESNAMPNALRTSKMTRRAIELKIFPGRYIIESGSQKTVEL